jgi:hypothetical protein
MSDEPNPQPRNVWRTRAIDAARTISESGREITLKRVDFPTEAVVVAIADKTPFAYPDYRSAAQDLIAWAKLS